MTDFVELLERDLPSVVQRGVDVDLPCLAAGDRHSWEVSWLPGRHMNRNSAITAMMLVDVTGPGDIGAGHRLWPHVSGWAAELALTAPEALIQMAGPPAWANVGRSDAIADPEAAE